MGGYMYRQDQRWHGVRGIWGEGLPSRGHPAHKLPGPAGVYPSRRPRGSSPPRTISMSDCLNQIDRLVSLKSQHSIGTDQKGRRLTFARTGIMSSSAVGTAPMTVCPPRRCQLWRSATPPLQDHRASPHLHRRRSVVRQDESRSARLEAAMKIRGLLVLRVYTRTARPVKLRGCRARLSR